MGTQQREIFMNVPAHRGGPEMSFEETRIRDYITAYQTTGKPPQPLPAEPADPAERARQGLPPPWVPYSEMDGIPVPLDRPSMQRIHTNAPERSASDLTTLPEVQVFTPTSVSGDSAGQAQHMQNVVCQQTFSTFSPEELRYRAYWIGKKYAPEVVQKATTPVPAPVATVVPTLTVTTPSLSGAEDTFQSITCQPPYSKHSFEELRLACYRTRHEITSEQIIQTRVL